MTTRIRAAINLLRGRPVAYKMHFHGPVIFGERSSNGYIAECFFDAAREEQ